MKMKKHKVTVVVPTIERESLKLCLEGLHNQTRKADEILLITNKDGKGVSEKRNAGILKAKGDVVVFLDDDCIPPKVWLASLLKVLDKYEADGVGGNYEETDPFIKELATLRPRKKQEQVDETGLVATAGNVMYKRSWLLRLLREDGYMFNESMPTGEDWELAWRLRRKGAKLVYTTQTVKHLRKVTFANYIPHQFYRGVGIAHLHRIQASSKSKVPLQKSLLWSNKAKTKWIKIIIHAGLGPFNFQKFKHKRYFFLYWLGQKSRSLGFLYGLWQARKNKKINKVISFG